MKRFNIIIVLVTLTLSFFMYSKTYIIVRQYAEDFVVAIKLNNYNGDDSSAVLPDKNKIQVVFVFDDGWESVNFAAYPIFKKYNYKGNVAIIPSLVNEKDYLSYKQIGEFYMDRWDILNHSYSHYRSNDSNQLINEFLRASNWMKNRFLTKGEKMAVIPYGECNPYILKLLINSKYENVRASDNIIAFDEKKTNYYPISFCSLLNDVTVSEVKSMLLEADKEKHAIGFILHKVTDEADEYQMTYSPNKLEEIVRYIHENEEKFQVVPYSSLFE